MAGDSNGAVPETLRLSTGEVVRVNDHVFCQTPFIGHAWAVCRIMEILRPAPAAVGQRAPVEEKVKEGEMRVKLAVYLRPDEVNGRHSKDNRLLFAAFKSFIHPVSNLRGRCYVKHKSHIDDLAAWKKEPNHFYYEKLYDEYLKRDYEVVGVKAFLNLPDEIRDILLERYSFLVCEKEAFSEYSVEKQSCKFCLKWASPPDSVRCSVCAESFHMRCCTPKVSSKPIRGYSWTCAPCYVQHEADVNNHRVPAKPKLEKALKTAAEAAAKVPSADKRLKIFRGWPMRYLGLHNLAEDTMDADDGIFPRTISRVGTKFQATWLPEVGDFERGEDIYERGGDETAKLKSKPCPEVDEMMKYVGSSQHSPETFTISAREQLLFLASHMSCEKAWRAFQDSRLTQVDKIEPFTPSQLQALVKSLAEHHGLDSHHASLLTGRSPGHCVRKYREWKEQRLREFYLDKYPTDPQYKDNPSPEYPLFGEEGLLAEKDLIYTKAVRGVTSCSTCTKNKTARWWTMIHEDFDGIYCETCHDFFLRYSQLPKKPPPEVAPKLKVEKHKADGEVLDGEPPRQKRKYVRKNQPVPTPPPPPQGTPAPVFRPPPKPLPCACCKIHDLANPVARCATCSYSIHPACYGIEDESSVTPDWLCALCANVETEQYRRVPRCVLCPSTWKTKGPPPTVPQQTQLQALKPTLEGNWAHIYCSVFQPATYLSHPPELELTEGVHLAEREARIQPCSICHRANQGVVVACADCTDVFHVSCAYKQGYTFGMEINLVKSSRKDISVVKFQEERGIMNAKIICKKHDLEGRVIYPPHEKDETIGQTALQTYVDTYKTAPVNSSAHPSLRRAEILQRELSVRSPPRSSVSEETSCCRCGVAYSPKWWTTEDAARESVCHRCWLRPSPPDPPPANVDSSSARVDS